MCDVFISKFGAFVLFHETPADVTARYQTASLMTSKAPGTPLTRTDVSAAQHLWSLNSVGAERVVGVVREICGSVEKGGCPTEHVAACCKELHTRGVGTLAFLVEGHLVLALPREAYAAIFDHVGDVAVPHLVEELTLEAFAKRAYGLPEWAPTSLADRIRSLCTTFAPGGLTFPEEHPRRLKFSTPLFRDLFKCQDFPEGVSVTTLRKWFLPERKGGHVDVARAEALAPVLNVVEDTGFDDGRLLAVILCHCTPESAVAVLRDLRALPKNTLTKVLKAKPLARICALVTKGEHPSVELAYAAHILLDANRRKNVHAAEVEAAKTCLEVAEEERPPTQPETSPTAHPQQRLAQPEQSAPVTAPSLQPRPRPAGGAMAEGNTLVHGQGVVTPAALDARMETVTRDDRHEVANPEAGLGWDEACARLADDTCSVCLKPPNNVAVLTTCHHFSCKKCIFTWARSRASSNKRVACPCCRVAFDKDDVQNLGEVVKRARLR